VSKKRKQPPCWYQMVSYFDHEAKTIMEVPGGEVVLSGWVPPDNECAVVLAPTSITQEQGLALQKLVEANFRRPVLVLTKNVQLVRLQKITATEAQKIIEGTDEDVKVIETSEQQGEGDPVREEDRAGDAADLRSPGAAEGAGDGGSQGSVGVSSAAEAVSGSSE